MLFFTRPSDARLTLWIAFAFLVGTGLHAVVPFVRLPYEVWVWGGISLLFMGVVLHGPWRIASFLCLLAALGGAWRFDVTIPLHEPHTELVGVVSMERKYDTLVKDEETGSGVSLSGKYRVGERLHVTCGQLERIPAEAKSIFDARQGAWFRCRGGVSVTRLSSSEFDPRRALQAWRMFLTTRIQTILPGDQGALLSGILYGERGLSSAASALFKTAGMTHLIAVSGSNIALVAALFVPFFLFVGYRRPTAILLSGAAILLFVLFVGAQASVVRAAVMGWLALLARVFGRKASAARLLVIAACAIVVFDPWALAFDAGFALSFLATWGLLMWSRPFATWLKWLPEQGGIREGAATTLAATIVTFPYSLWAFGQASLAGLLTNLVAIPLVGLAMLWGTVALTLGKTIPWTALPASGFLQGMLLISQSTQFVPWARIAWVLPTWMMFGVYLFIVLIASRRGDKRRDDPHQARRAISSDGSEDGGRQSLLTGW